MVQDGGKSEKVVKGDLLMRPPYKVKRKVRRIDKTGEENSILEPIKKHIIQTTDDPWVQDG